MTEERPLSELIEALIDYRGKTPPKSDSGIPLITAKVIKDGRIQDDHREYIAEETYESWMRRGLPRSGDILITTEAPLGEVAQVGSDAKIALAQRVILLRADPSAVDPQFLFHYLRSPNARARLMQRASGTTVSGIRQSELRMVSIPLLPRSAQRAVGQILDDLDALIQNSRRRVAVLEEMARSVYHEWFVCLRFPGYDTAKFLDSPLGPIPQDWSVGRVDEHFLLQRGFDLPAGSRQPGSIPVIGASGPQGFHSTPAAADPGVTTGRSGTIGTVTYVTSPYWPLNTVLWVKEFRLATPRSAYFLLTSLDLNRLAAGAAVPTLNRNVVHALPTLCPPRELLERWDALVSPMFESMDRIRLEAHSLLRMRELLLPKLVTGEIDASALDLSALARDAVA